MKIKWLIFAVCGILSLSASVQAKTYKTIEADIFLMSELPGRYNYRLLTRGFDSAGKSWGLDYGRPHFSAKPYINYRNQSGKHFKVEVELQPFQLNRLTLCFEETKATMYLNGNKIGETTSFTPPEDNYYQMKIGAYMNGKMKFPGRVTNVKLLDKVVVPQKITPKGSSQTHFSFISTDVKKPIPFKVIKGNWKKSPWGFGEFSDNSDTRALAITEQVMPENFVYTARVGTFDLYGQIFLEFCRQDDKNGYKLIHQSGSAMKVLLLYKTENGIDTLLGRISSETMVIPHTGTRVYPLTLSVGRHNGMIHVRINGEEALCAYDDTFKKGHIGFGVYERSAKFRQISVTSYSDYCVENKPKISPKHELLLNTPSLRTVFYRDEKIVLNAEVINRTSANFNPGTVQFTFNDQKLKWTPGAVGGMKSTVREIEIDGRKYSDGDYILTLSNGKLKSSFKITLVSRPQDEPYRFYNWCNGDLAEMNRNYFNGITFDITPKDNVKYLRPLIASMNDYAIKHNMKLGVHYPMLSQVPSGGKSMTVIRKDGTSSGKLNARHPKTQAYLKKGAEAVAGIIKDYPAINRVLLDSEAENFIEPGYTKEDIARAKKELGFEPPMSNTSDVELDNTKGRKVSLPKSVIQATPAVFPVDNKNYRFMLWFWDRGAGDNLIRAEVADIIRKGSRNIVIHHDPYRDVPLSSRMLNMDSPGTWFYCHPDAGETFMAVESQLSVCRAGKRPEKFILDPSLWLYNHKIGLAKNIWAGVQPANIYLTSLHLGFAAKPELIEIYNLNFVMPHSKAQFKEKHIRAEISKFVKNFVQPLWSATRKLDREAPKTALILSFGSQIFSKSHWSGYGGAEANTILNLFWKANIPTAIITEEEIRAGKLANYDNLLLYRTSHLPQDVFDKIKDYAAKGGKVLTEPDSPWAKLIPSSVKYPIETRKITKSTYYEIIYRKGFTADIVYSEQQRIAKDLRKFRKQDLTFADSNSTELYIRTLQAADSRYVFLMNDKRTFGDYFGKKYKAVYDAGLPLKAEVSLKTEGAVYEFPAQKKLTLKNGKVVLDFKPVEGKVLIVYPEAVASVNVKNIPTFTAGKNADFEISILDAKQKKVKGIQPIRITLTKPGNKKMELFTSAVNGTVIYSYLPGINAPAGKWKLEVEELASGTKTFREWTR